MQSTPLNNVARYKTAAVPVSPTAILELQGGSPYQQKITVGDLLSGGIAIGLTAVGSTRANALALTKRINVISTAASAAVGVVLPPSATVGVGGHVDVINDYTGFDFHLYGDGSDTVDSVAGATGVTIPNGYRVRYQLNSAGAYVSYRYPVMHSGSIAGIATGLTAVGTSRANALQLAKRVNIVATAASAAVGVNLPASALFNIGDEVEVYNDGPANAFHVYALGSDTVDGTAGATGVVLTNAFMCRYKLTAAGAFTSYCSAIARSA